MQNRFPPHLAILAILFAGISLLFITACGGSGAHSAITVTADTPETVEHGDAVNVNSMLGVTTAELGDETLIIGGSVAPMPTMVLDDSTISDPNSEAEEDDGAL